MHNLCLDPGSKEKIWLQKTCDYKWDILYINNSLVIINGFLLYSMQVTNLEIWGWSVTMSATYLQVVQLTCKKKRY